jgi:predicted glutamine amidotransferase
MCELLGLSFSEPISADFSLSEFELRDVENADGWGLGWYPDQSLAIVKEPVMWERSLHSGFLKSYQALCSRIYIGHVRHKTTGGQPSHADTHPFARELGGREYCFAHNGTLLGRFWDLPLGRYRPIGGTDSEHLFCHLMEQIAQQDKDFLETPTGWIWLHDFLHDLNRRGKINCLLTDGQRLFCYRDSNGWKGLAIRKVYVPDGSKRSFGDPEIRFNLASSGVNHGFVVATGPLSPTGWQTFDAGELMVLSGGLVKMSGHNMKLLSAFAPQSYASTPQGNGETVRSESKERTKEEVSSRREERGRKGVGFR